MSNLVIGDRWRPAVDISIESVKGYIELTLTDDTVVKGTTPEDIAACSTIAAATTEITVGGQTFRKDQVKKVRFGEDFDLTSLENFGYNFTNLIEIDRIPEGITGNKCLSAFLRGCTSFNQPITIPEGVTGWACLNTFLRGCTSFNQPITIPEGVTGDWCLGYFLYETAFNHPITIPDSVTGKSCLRYFLNNCYSFNQPITIPEGVTGDYCLDYFLSDCTKFNQPITIPNGINGIGCLNNFLKSCHKMISPVTVNDASGLVSDVGTLSTTNNGATMYTQGIPILGAAATAFRAKFPNRSSEPFRKLK